MNGAAPDLVDIAESETLTPDDLQRAKTAETLPKKTRDLLGARRRSSAGGSVSGDSRAGRRGASTDELKQHLKHLGPSNLASRPRTTRYNTVKIKPGMDTAPKRDDRPTPIQHVSESASEHQTGIGEGTVPSAGKDASDGVQALIPGYGSISSSPSERRPQSASKAMRVSAQEDATQNGTPTQEAKGVRPSARTFDSHSTIGSLPDSRAQSKSGFYHSKAPARSGSITENIVDTNGIRKVVLETTSSSESNEEDNSGANKRYQSYDESKASSTSQLSHENGSEQNEDASKKKKRRRRKHERNKGEREPLLGN